MYLEAFLRVLYLQDTLVLSKGWDTFGRMVASETSDLWLKFSQSQFPLRQLILLFSDHCIYWKVENKEKEVGSGSCLYQMVHIKL